MICLNLRIFGLSRKFVTRVITKLPNSEQSYNEPISKV
jgi:hypothetical protein